MPPRGLTWMYQTAITAVLGLVLCRCGWLLIGLIRLVPVHLRARTRKWGAIELLTLVELPLFFALAYHLYARAPVSASPGALALLAACAGVLLALAGVLISLWSLYTTYRSGIILDAGHFIKKDHALVTTGAYGFVRNPMYLGVFLIWLGAGVAFESLGVLLIALLYVIPAYLLYIQSEEKMLVQQFGDEYRRYCERVGRILPRWTPRLRQRGR